MGYGRIGRKGCLSATCSNVRLFILSSMQFSTEEFRVDVNILPKYLDRLLLGPNICYVQLKVIWILCLNWINLLGNPVHPHFNQTSNHDSYKSRSLHFHLFIKLCECVNKNHFFLKDKPTTLILSPHFFSTFCLTWTNLKRRHRHGLKTLIWIRCVACKIFLIEHIWCKWLKVLNEFFVWPTK